MKKKASKIKVENSNNINADDIAVTDFKESNEIKLWVMKFWANKLKYIISPKLITTF